MYYIHTYYVNIHLITSTGWMGNGSKLAQERNLLCGQKVYCDSAMCTCSPESLKESIRELDS